MLSCARHGDWLPVRGAQGASPYFGYGHINILFSQTSSPIRIKSGMRHQDNKALSGCAHFPDPLCPKELGDNRPPNPAFLRKKIFLSVYMDDCTELNTGAFGAFQNVKLWSAWWLAPRAEGSGGRFFFGSENENVLLSQTTRIWPTRTKFVMRYEFNEALSDCALHLNPTL